MITVIPNTNTSTNTRISHIYHSQLCSQADRTWTHYEERIMNPFKKNSNT